MYREIPQERRGCRATPMEALQLDNLQTVAKDRFVKYLGSLDNATMVLVGRTVILALGLDEVL